MLHLLLHVKTYVAFFGIEDYCDLADKERMTNWLEPYLKKADLSQEELAERIGKSRATVNRIANGHTQLTRKVAAQLAPHLKVSIEELLVGTGPAPPKVTQPERPDGIPNLDIHAGMGNGGAGHIEVDQNTLRPLPEYTDGDWIFPPAYMQRLGNLKGKYALPVQGDSMEPTISAGSVVFIDTNAAYPSAPGLYVVDAGDGRLVKRVELIAGTDKIAIMSDNPSYRNYEFNREDVQIFGRVIATFSFNE